MFVRQKKNASGKISVQVIDKSSGKYKVVKSLGSSSDKTEIHSLIQKGEEWIKSSLGIIELNFSPTKENAQKVLDNIDQITVSGVDLLLNKIYDEIGFSQIDDNMFRVLVIYRLAYPSSKLKTSDLLQRYHSLKIDVQSIYRYLDKLYKVQKSLVEEISYNHTLKILGGKISVVFYDVTTIYFQIDEEDEIRKRGFSKEGKHQNPQILLGLLVSYDGYPLAYDIFEGNQFEGHTMLPVIDHFKNKYNIDSLVIIADSGLLSNKNVEELEKKGYEYILGARLKNMKSEIKEKVLSSELKSGETNLIKVNKCQNLVISYSDSRAKKDRHNRERGLNRLEKQLNTGKLTKANINKRGYNKYLKMSGKIEIAIDMEKFEKDAEWDGIKGYLTNTKLTQNDVIENYNQLWKIEKAFRVSKHDLKIRPIYHRLQRRIEAHVTISFAAYKIYKELERLLKLKGSKLSPEKAIDIAKTIYSIRVKVPQTNENIEKTLILNEEQRELADIFKF